MNILGFILALGAGIVIDRAVIWERDRAVIEERRAHVRTIRDLQARLQEANLERYAAEKSLGRDVKARNYLYANPNFEEDFLRYGRARTQIIPRGRVPKNTQPAKESA